MKYILYILLIFILTGFFFFLSNKNKTEYSYYFSNTGEETFVLLHGVPGNQETFSLMRNELEEKNKGVLLPHLTGSTIKEDLEYVSELLETLEITNATLVVHDRGGLVGLGLLENNSKLFNRVIILDTVLESFKSPFAQNLLGESLTGILYSDTIIGASMLRTTLEQGGVPDSQVMVTEHRQNIRSFLTNFSEVESYIEKNKISLKNYSGEITVFWGEHDPFLPKETHLQTIRDIVPQENIYILKDAKHYIQYTHAKEIVGLILEK